FFALQFAAGFGGAELLAIDGLGRTVAFSAAGEPQRTLAETRGGLFAGLAVSGDRLYVSSGLGPGSIAQVSPDGTIMLLAPPSSTPFSLAVSPDGHTLYYADAFGGDLVQVDTR